MDAIVAQFNSHFTEYGLLTGRSFRVRTGSYTKDCPPLAVADPAGRYVTTKHFSEHVFCGHSLAVKDTQKDIRYLIGIDMAPYLLGVSEPARLTNTDIMDLVFYLKSGESEGRFDGHNDHV
jgi:hypothetical protein